MAKQAPVVIDSGEFSIKGGIAGEEEPSVLAPTLVGRSRLRALEAAGAFGQNICAGGDACSLDPVHYAVTSPIRRGVVASWDDMERLWGLVFDICGAGSVGKPVLLAEVPLNSTTARARAAQILFETFHASSVYFVSHAALALYSTGMTTGLVLDCGEGMSHAVPVYEGCVIREGICSSQLGGADVSAHLLRHLRRAGFEFSRSIVREIVRNFKETECYASSTKDVRHDKDFDKKRESPKLYKLPDGTAMIPMGMERCLAPEVLFDPASIGLECPSVAGLVYKALKGVDMNVRADLLTKLSLAGGTTMLKGFGERLMHDLRLKIPKDVRMRMTIPPKRQYSAWVGGSIFGALSTFEHLAVSKAEFMEQGGRVFDTHVEAYFKERSIIVDREKYPELGKSQSSPSERAT